MRRTHFTAKFQDRLASAKNKRRLSLPSRSRLTTRKCGRLFNIAIKCGPDGFFALPPRLGVAFGALSKRAENTLHDAYGLFFIYNRQGWRREGAPDFCSSFHHPAASSIMDRVWMCWKKNGNGFCRQANGMPVGSPSCYQLSFSLVNSIGCINTYIYIKFGKRSSHE